jgi:glycosyltransferase involved in cell wall biosynthesis
MTNQATLLCLKADAAGTVREKQVKILHVIAEPRSWQFFDGQAAYFRAHGFEVHAASSPGPLLRKFGEVNHVEVHPVPIERRISLLKDIVSVWRLVQILRDVRPELLHAHFSKSGIIGMVAGFLARTPVRIYHNHGMALSSARGWKRAILWAVETLTCLLAHRVIYVAPSVLADAAKLHVCNSPKALAILSANGLDYSERFSRLLYGRSFWKQGRERLGIPADAFVVGYVGRILKIKGIDDLIRAWQALSTAHSTLHLVFVGEFDRRDPISSWAEDMIRSDSRIHLTGFVEEPAAVYPIMDLLVLPSYHEGLGYSLLEAAAMELPVIGTRIPGIVDALQENINGLLVPTGCPAELAGAIGKYMRDPALAAAHGRAGRDFVVSRFQRSAVWESILEIYQQQLDARRKHRSPVFEHQIERGI